MAEYITINLMELFEEVDNGKKVIVFEDDYFRRETFKSRIKSFIDTDIIIDSLDIHGMKSCHFSMCFPKKMKANFTFEGAEITRHLQGWFIKYTAQETLLWIPKAPVSRSFDDNSRIIKQTKLPFELLSGSDKFVLDTTDMEGERVEFSLVIFTQNIQSITKEILLPVPIERRKVVRSNWFVYKGINDVWDYFINGTVYNSCHQYYDKGWQAQHTAYTVYYHLEFLYHQTKKEIYKLLNDLIAYSVMLSLPRNCRWQHGSWTDLIETHTVHQVSGIHLLMSYFEQSGSNIFLNKSYGAMDYLIEIADRLDDGELWFLHDSLETRAEDARLYYKSVATFRAFGKSIPNTLCINSHMWTLIALYRLQRFDTSGRYKDFFESGLRSLRRILQTTPCSILYAGVYWQRDLILKLYLKYSNPVTRKARKICDILLRRYILPFLKKKFPRLIMPNGYTERDLTYSSLSDVYHFINIEDMLILYSQTRSKWLRDIIKKSMRYSINSSLVRYLAGRNIQITIFLDILLLYSSLIDEKYLMYLPEYISFFQELNLPVSVDVLSNPLIANTSSPLSVDNKNLIVLAPSDNTRFDAIVINVSENEENALLKSTQENRLSGLELLDPEGNKFSSEQRFVVPGGGFIKIVKKYGQD